MSPTSDPRPGGANNIGGGHVEVRPCRISHDSVVLDFGGSIGSIFVCLRLCGYRFDLSNLQLFSSAMVATIVRWSFRVLAR